MNPSIGRKAASSVLALLSSVVILSASAQMPANAPIPPGAVKKPGELWRQKMSMNMPGMSMPARTQDICQPKEAPESGAGQLPDQSCSITDFQQAGGKSTLKFRCDGQMAGDGTIQTTRQGNTMISDITLNSKRGTMNMHSESTRLGTACEYIDYSKVKIEQPKIAAAVDSCAESVKKIQEDSGNVAGYSREFIGSSGQCKAKPAMKEFCAALQTHRGFWSMRVSDNRAAEMEKEWQAQDVSKMSASQQKDRLAVRKLDDPALRTPLLSSLKACGLGKDATGIDKLRGKLLASAEQTNVWYFMAIEGDDAVLDRMKASAQQNCTGRRYTEAKAAEFRGLCRPYAANLIAGRYDLVRGKATADGDGGPNGQMASAAGTPATGNAAENATEGCPEGDADCAKTNKVKDAMNKTKKAFRGLFGH
jgi:hypothetical protein